MWVKSFFFFFTFEKEVRVILEGVIRLLHGNEARVYCLPLLALPWLCNQLGPKLQDQAEDAVDDVHDRSCFLGQQTSGDVREGKMNILENKTRNSEGTFLGLKLYTV